MPILAAPSLAVNILGKSLAHLPEMHVAHDLRRDTDRDWSKSRLERHSWNELFHHEPLIQFSFENRLDRFPRRVNAVSSDITPAGSLHDRPF